MWPLVDADLHDVYGIDTATGILRKRTASWLTARIVGVIGKETSLTARALNTPTPT